MITSEKIERVIKRLEKSYIYQFYYQDKEEFFKIYLKDLDGYEFCEVLLPEQREEDIERAFSLLIQTVEGEL